MAAFTANRSNVTLIDCRKTDIGRITDKGVLVDGVEHELDCLRLRDMRLTVKAREILSVVRRQEDRTSHALSLLHV